MIRPFGFFNVSRLSASFTMVFAKELAESRDAYHHEVRHFWLYRDGDRVQRDKPWKTANAFLTTLRNEAAPLFGGKAPTFRDVMVRSIAPGGRVDWHRDEDNDPVHRVHICLNPSPGARIFSGEAVICPPVGNLFVVERRLLNSEINLGPCPLVELVAELVSPDQGDTDDREALALEALEA